MLKTLAQDIMKNPDLWLRNEGYLERTLTIAIKGYGVVRLQLFNHPHYAVWVSGNWYKVPWHKRSVLTRAKKVWVKYHYNMVKDLYIQNSMTTEAWIKWREDQLDKK